jgi:PKD repeat protein
MSQSIDRWIRLLAHLLLWVALTGSLAARAAAPLCDTDIDGNGSAAPASDGQLLLRYLFGFAGDELITGVVGSGCTRCDAAAIATHLETVACRVFFDVDGDGTRGALTDGLLVWRYLAGLTGTALTADAVGAGCTRCMEAEMVAHLTSPLAPQPNQAILGPLSGATISAYRLNDLATAVEGPLVAEESLTDLRLAGTFKLDLASIPDDEWILATATGGQDIDADDDGVLDTNPRINYGTLHALARAADWRNGGLRVNVLTEIAWQSLRDNISIGQIDDLEGRLTWIANQLFFDDMTGDGNLDARDLTAFDPRLAQFRDALQIPFDSFLADDAAGSSLLDKIHDGLVDEVRVWITSVFGDRLQPPRDPVTVETTTEVLLPPNGAGLTAQDLVIMSSAGSGAEILAGSATLMIAKDAEGRPVLLAFALPGQVTQFSGRSTALALVMLSLGGGRDEQSFSGLAALVESLVEFNALTQAIENLLAADPFFLDRLASYVDLVEQIQSVVAKVKATITLATAAAPASVSQPRSMATDSGFPITKTGFYRIPLIVSSPWRASQPWDWYGDAKGVEAVYPDNLQDAVFIAILGTQTGVQNALNYIAADAYAELLADYPHPPFLAVSQGNRTEIALANPSAANYALELIAADGSVTDWYLTPRNESLFGTLFGKLLNSGAAKRSLYSAATDEHRQSLNDTHLQVRFNRWPSVLTARGLALGFLNFTHLGVSALNLAHDFSAVSKVLEAMALNERAIRILGECGALQGLASAWEDLQFDSTVQSSWKETGGLLVDAAWGGVMEVTLEIALNGPACIGEAAKAVGADWNKLFSKQIVASTIDALGTLTVAKVVFDAANDTVPTWLSILWPSSEQQDYYLTWDRDASDRPILTDVSTTPPPAAPLAPPRPFFTSVQKSGEGLRVYFDASQSRLDARAIPSYTWDFGDGSTGSEQQTSHLFTAAGTREVRLSVNDGLGQTAEWAATLTVRNGSAPVIGSMTCAIDPSNPRRVVVTAGVSDADGDLAFLEWSLVFQIAPDETTTPDVTQVALVYPDDGTISFAPTLRARDAAGNVTPRTCQVYQGRVDTYPLNDTGLDWCANATQNNLACPVSGFPGQDAESGRDLTHHDDSDGQAGFSFTKIANSGNALPAAAVLGSGANDWGCTRDNVTGLTWEVKTNDGGLRDQDWTYSWYNPDAATNGGGAGYADYGNNCFDTARCDTHKYVADVNSQGLCSASDWRLPNRFELESITSNDRYNPAIDTVFFPNTPLSWFWSSSPRAYYSDDAWYVGFGNGAVGYYPKSGARDVRLVRGGQ